MPDSYETANFMTELRAWMRRENPSSRLLAIVAEWEPMLKATPHAGDADGGHLLFRVVPGTEHHGYAVTLSYTVETGGRITCLLFRCQPFPIGVDPPAWPPEPHRH